MLKKLMFVVLLKQENRTKKIKFYSLTVHRTLCINCSIFQCVLLQSVFLPL